MASGSTAMPNGLKSGCSSCFWESPEGENVCLLPKALCCPALVLAANHSLLVREQPLPDDLLPCSFLSSGLGIGQSGADRCRHLAKGQFIYGLCCCGVPAVSQEILLQREHMRHSFRAKYSIQQGYQPGEQEPELAASIVCYPCSLYHMHAYLREKAFLGNTPFAGAGHETTGSSGPLTAGLKLPKEPFSVKMASSTMGKGSNAYSTPPGTPPKPANSSATSAGGATAVAASSSASHAPRHAPAGLLADDGTALVTASSRQHQAQQNRGAVQQSHAEQAHAAALSGRPSTGGGQAVATAAMYASLEHLSAGDDAGFSVSGASHHGAGNGGQLSESQSMSITLCLPQRPLHLHASATESTVPKPNSHAQQAVTDITHGSPADTLGSGGSISIPAPVASDSPRMGRGQLIPDPQFPAPLPRPTGGGAVYNVPSAFQPPDTQDSAVLAAWTEAVPAHLASAANSTGIHAAAGSSSHADSSSVAARPQAACGTSSSCGQHTHPAASTAGNAHPSAGNGSVQQYSSISSSRLSSMVDEAMHEVVADNGEWPADTLSGLPSPVARALTTGKGTSTNPDVFARAGQGSSRTGSGSSVLAQAASQQKQTWPRFREVKPATTVAAHMPAPAITAPVYDNKSLVNYDSVVLGGLEGSVGMQAPSQQAQVGHDAHTHSRSAQQHGGGFAAGAGMHGHHDGDVDDSLPNYGTVNIPSHAALAIAAALDHDSLPNYGTVNLASNAAAAYAAGLDSSLSNFGTVNLPSRPTAAVGGLDSCLPNFGTVSLPGHAAAYAGGLDNSLPNLGTVNIPASTIYTGGVSDSLPNYGTVNLPSYVDAALASGMKPPEQTDDVVHARLAGRIANAAYASDISSMDTGSLTGSRGASSKASQHVRINYVNPMQYSLASRNPGTAGVSLASCSTMHAGDHGNDADQQDDCRQWHQ